MDVTDSSGMPDNGTPGPTTAPEATGELVTGAAGTTEHPGSFERRLPPQPASVGEARRMIRELLARSDRDDLVETAVLLISEVVTNALLHAGTPIDVAARLDDDGLRVEVGDGSLHLPVRRRYATTAGTGRGLLMLEQLVDDWGVSRHQRGKTVWFRLDAGDRETGDAVEGQSESDHRPDGAETVDVELRNVPLLLHAAWQEHAEACCASSCWPASRTRPTWTRSRCTRRPPTRSPSWRSTSPGWRSTSSRTG